MSILNNKDDLKALMVLVGLLVMGLSIRTLLL